MEPSPLLPHLGVQDGRRQVWVRQKEGGPEHKCLGQGVLG